MMQSITREMNFSECTFIFPPEMPDTEVRMRIFTPGEELPMAGHPTVGITFALAKEGVIAAGPGTTSSSGLASDRRRSRSSGRQRRDRLRLDDAEQADLRRRRSPTARRFAAAIGVGKRSGGSRRPEAVSCGEPFLFAPLRSRDARSIASTIDRAQYAQGCAAAGSKTLPLLIFTLEGERRRSDLQPDARARLRRLRRPGDGQRRGPLGCYLHKHQLLAARAARHTSSTCRA